MEKGALIGQGRTADVFAWGQDRILKLYQPFMPPDAVNREYELTRVAGKAGLPVPAVEELVEVDGRHGIIFERLSGPSMLKVMMVQPAKIVSLAGQLGKLHAQVHHSLAPAGLRTQRQQIESAVRSSPHLSETSMRAVLACLEQLPQGSCLCHGDFHPDNVLLTPSGPMIIDWMTACRGDAVGDAGRTVMIFRTSGLPEDAALIMKMGYRLVRMLVLSSYRRHYLRAQPATNRELEAWQLPLLAARLREVEAYPREKQMILQRIQTLLEKGA